MDVPVKLLHVVGARPNFPKLAPVLHAGRKAGLQQIVVHTGQHYDSLLSTSFFDDLDIPLPDYTLESPRCESADPLLPSCLGDLSMTQSCLFCRIVERKIPASVVFEDEHTLAFRDIDPKAPTHVLVIPKLHVATLNEAMDATLLGRLFLAAKVIAAAEGIAEGYRTVVNCGAAAGQTVFHVHVHLLGGRELGWPPG
ncbi:MAG: HIT domain-containing protein [Gemmatimonadaceae bacterium]